MVDVNKIPAHVSWYIQDAWLVKPPCMLSDPYCHVDCPYYSDCYPPDDTGDDDQWDNYITQQQHG